MIPNEYELMLGNYVIDELTGEWMEVTELAVNRIVATVINRDKFPLPDGWKMAPIPLTQEVIKRFPFSKSNDLYRYAMFSFFAEDDFFIFYDGSIRTRLDYVHQLQNLFYTITGKRLKLI